ncbi:neuromedin Ba [Pygocentrus nattereri]|uniref:neuromedin Ba n=1 Tax=Pygocentrus nattereri TaxID=42514 RepID=UPI00081467DA|nr:neuromedin Ba [Pygocentrus nattereri]
MAVRSLGGICKLGLLLFSLVMLSYLPISTSVSLDLTELRNKVSKIKVNPRGNLWATGHFMGRKSIPDGCVDLSELKQEQRAMQHPQQRTDPINQNTDFLVKLLKSYFEERKR